jgi:hypothetical protein
MATEADFDPARVGGALLVLESKLREELFDNAPGPALLKLRQELVDVIRQARAWAERRGVPHRFIPETPTSEAGPGQCLTLLRDLAAALQFLGSRDRVPDSMAEVVEWLKLHRSKALTELTDLGQVADELASALGALEAAARRLNEALTTAASVLNGSAPAISLARTQANAMHELAQLVLDTIEELQLGFAVALGEPDSEAL